MRYIVCTLFLCGCVCTEQPDPVAEVPKSTVADKYADAQDAANSKAAAAVVQARVANTAGLPKVVDKELSVAEAYLPRPSSTDVEEARKRAAGVDDKTYSDALARADKLQKQIDDAWNAVEQEKARNEQLERQLVIQREQDRKDDAISKFQWIGSLLMLAGVGMIVGSRWFSLGIAREGAIVLGLGVGSLAAPFIFESAWFAWISGATIAFGVLILAVRFWKNEKRYRSQRGETAKSISPDVEPRP